MKTVIFLLLSVIANDAQPINEHENLKTGPEMLQIDEHAILKKDFIVVKPHKYVKKEKKETEVDVDNDKLEKSLGKLDILSNVKISGNTNFGQRQKQEKNSVLSENVMSVDNTNTKTVVSDDVTNSKLDKLLNMMSGTWDMFKWENSMLTEMAQTLSYLFDELKRQEKRIKQLNRNVNTSLKVLLDGKDIEEVFSRKGSLAYKNRH